MLHITTFATDENKLKYLNYPSIINLGKNKKWNNYIDKLIAVQNYIQNLPDSDILLFTDSYDVVFLENSDDTIKNIITSKFFSYNTEILFSAETSCFPWNHVQDLYPHSKTKYRFLNSGGYIGFVYALKKLLQLSSFYDSPCDQGYFTYCYINMIHSSHIFDNTKLVKIMLDTECKLFQTAYAIPWEEFYIKSGKLYNTYTNSTPSLIHYNGNQFLTKENNSIIPILYNFIQDSKVNIENVYTFVDYKQKYPIFETNSDVQIINLAVCNARKYKLPDQETILGRDGDNYHSIFTDKYFITRKTVNQASHYTKIWEAETRSIVENFLKLLPLENKLKLDISIHDFVGLKSNSEKWPHSILGFSTTEDDNHNILIPDLYAMQNYKGVLYQPDNIPTLSKINKMIFIGSSTGKNNERENKRVQLCKFANQNKKNKDWIESYISDIVNFLPDEAKKIQKYLHQKIPHEEQKKYRHIISVDGNTACWDRIPWVLGSKSVCWKQDSDNTCWYYPFLKPWVHYIPFTLENLEERWNKVKDDYRLQLEIVYNANKFVNDYLKPRHHALYMTTLINEINKLNRLNVE